MSGDYNSLTRDAYRNKQRANRYHEQFSEFFSWPRMAMARELHIMQKVINNYDISVGDVILDAPCGTGIAGPMLAKLPATILASDISHEMMAYASDRYASDRLAGFVQADVTRLPLADDAVMGAVVLGFMHRVPTSIKASTFRELARVCRRFLVISASIDGFMFRIKKKIRTLMGRERHSAPEPMSFPKFVDIAKKEGFRVCRTVKVSPLLSSEVIFWMEKEQKKGDGVKTNGFVV